MKIGLIYKATTPSQTVYIGQTCNFQQRKRYHKNSSFNINSIGYNFSFHKAIRKYGWNNIQWEILLDEIPECLLNDLEIEYIKEYDSFKNGYNDTIGGDGVGSGQNHPAYGKKRSEETKRKLSIKKLGELNPNFGKSTWSKNKKFSEIHRANISKSKKDKPSYVRTKEINEKISKALKGKPKSEEHKRKISESKRRKK